jgi:hypothetical protein
MRKQFVAIRMQGVALAHKRIGDGSPEAPIGDVMERARHRRQEAPRELVLALRTP